MYSTGIRLVSLFPPSLIDIVSVPLANLLILGVVAVNVGLHDLKDLFRNTVKAAGHGAVEIVVDGGLDGLCCVALRHQREHQRRFPVRHVTGGFKFFFCHVYTPFLSEVLDFVAVSLSFWPLQYTRFFAHIQLTICTKMRVRYHEEYTLIFVYTCDILSRKEVLPVPIKYKTDILEALKAKGYSTYRIRKEKLFAESTVQAFRRGDLVSLDNIARVCELLNCQPGDILEYKEEQ